MLPYKMKFLLAFFCINIYISHAELVIIAIFYLPSTKFGYGKWYWYSFNFESYIWIKSKITIYYVRYPLFFLVNHIFSKSKSISNPILRDFHNFIWYYFKFNIKTTSIAEIIKLIYYCFLVMIIENTIIC